MKLFSPLIFTAIFFSCTNKESRLLTIDKFKPGIPQMAGVDYFPADSLFFSSVNKSKSKDSFIRRWYSEILYNLKEPVLYSYWGEGQAIRFVWLRSFESPVVIRINKFNDTIYASIKELKLKAFEDEVPEIVKDTMVLLEEKKWQKSLSVLEFNNFWNAVVEDTSSENVKDGVSWFLECRLPDKYHCINRWDDGSFSSKDLNLYAKELIKIGERYVRMKSGK